MVELGNGDVFLFDIGTGSIENLFGLRPDFSKLDKLFLSHLHSDHFGDLDALIVGGWLSGRYTPLHVYGAAGALVLVLLWVFYSFRVFLLGAKFTEVYSRQFGSRA